MNLLFLIAVICCAVLPAAATIQESTRWKRATTAVKSPPPPSVIMIEGRRVPSSVISGISRAREPEEPNIPSNRSRPFVRSVYDSDNYTRCGPRWDYGVCDPNSDRPCCDYSDYCSGNDFLCKVKAKCKLEYGKCGREDECGPKVNGRCHGDFKDACCNVQDGLCGKEKRFCGEGCEEKYGFCYFSVHLPGGPRCGPDYGGFGCDSKDLPCCSKWGYCGASFLYCNHFHCLQSYGKCGMDYECGNRVKATGLDTATEIASGPSISAVGVNGLCHGKFLGQCCAKNNTCGATDAYCGKGCQPDHGMCTGVNEDRCGSKFHRKNCSEITAPCCSRWGFCGDNYYHCNEREGCHSGYGKCGGHETCGPEVNGKCHGIAEGMCCHKNGTCGIGEEFCGKDCLPEWGPCDERKREHDGRCGPRFGGATCDGDSQGPCCNRQGYCGQTFEHCNWPSCQIEYGKCGHPDKCGKDVNGKCHGLFKNQCCSAGGNCGTEYAYCGKGCQDKWGGPCWVIPERRCLVRRSRCRPHGVPCCCVLENENCKCREPHGLGTFAYKQCLPYRKVVAKYDVNRPDWAENRPVRWPGDCRPNVYTPNCPKGRSFQGGNPVEDPEVYQAAMEARQNDPEEIAATERAYKVARKAGLLDTILDEDYALNYADF